MAITPLAQSRYGAHTLGIASQTVTAPVNAAADSNVFDVRGYGKKQIYLRSTLNQTVTITIKGLYDPEATDSRTIGSAFTMAAGNVTPQVDEVHLSDYHGFLVVNYDPAADSTGTLVIRVTGQD